MQVKGIEVTVGCDPEFFLREGGLPTSAHFLIGKFGGKHNPLKLDYGAVQIDGTAVEFNIEPARTAEEFVDYVDKVLLQVRERIDTKYDFNYSPVQKYSVAQFAEIPPDAKELGCDPDYNAYTLNVNEKPDVAMPMRTGAGHIHLGWTKDLVVDSRLNMLDCAALVKQLDSVLYPASLRWDHDTQRRTMYGQPGSFRVKSYGVEYRALSNAWLKYPLIQKWIFEASLRAFELLMEGTVLPKSKWEDIKGNNFYELNRYMESLVKDHGIPPLPPTATFVG